MVACAARSGELRALVVRDADAAGELRREACQPRRRHHRRAHRKEDQQAREVAAGDPRIRATAGSPEMRRRRAALWTARLHAESVARILRRSGFRLGRSSSTYVIDDHRLVSPVAADAPMFEASFGVPFRTIWSGENRGFSGATNLGVAAFERAVRPLDEFGRHSGRVRLAREDALCPRGPSRDRDPRRAPASSERRRPA